MTVVDDATLHKHVYESNFIENIIAEPGDPFFDDHFAAARVAARGKIVHPNKLHRLLTRRIFGIDKPSGKYRKYDVHVGPHMAPRWQNVSELMQDWPMLVQRFKSLMISENIDEMARIMHDWFLCVHPYADGNGRTARLTWNMLLVSKGLPWHIEPAETKHRYYGEIRRFQEFVFKNTYPDVY